jgi:DNA-directed RNA polymerase specialized sigma24 family protein
MGRGDRAVPDDEGLWRRLDRRALAERVLGLAEHLTRAERTLIEQVYRDGQSFAEVGRRQRRPGDAVRQQVQRLVRRMLSDDFRFVVTAEALLPEDLRALARRRVLECRSLRDTARRTGRTLHDVRRADLRLRALLEAQRRGPLASLPPAPSRARPPEFNRW